MPTPNSSISGALDELLNTPEPPALTTGPRQGTLALAALSNQFDALVLAHPKLHKKEDALRCLVLLWHEHWTRAHEIAQDLHTPDGSLLHAILHRREPDAWNSKYWLRSTGAHEAYGAIGDALSADGRFTNQPWLRSGRFDAVRFVDACDQADNSSSNETDRLLRTAQEIELRTLARWFAGA